MRKNSLSFYKFLPILCVVFVLGYVKLIVAGTYADSAHADSTYGVDRSSITGYATGNCVHCHEQHASIYGEQPEPKDATPVPSNYALFFDNFTDATNPSPISGPYSMDDNFCFQCHVNSGGHQSGGSVINKQYAITFGGYLTDSATDILGAFNLSSYHNLKDVQTFAAGKFPSFFKTSSNPCVACHNPHVARDHNDNKSNPVYSTISMPSTDHNGGHEEVWGDDANELMSNYTYRPPYYYGGTTYEPGGVTLHNGSKTVDYVKFCMECHQYEVPVSTPGVASMNPNTTPGYLTAINWSSDGSGDMHGEEPRIQNIDGSPKGFGTVEAPYNTDVQANYVLSCLDCHDPHGSVLTTAGRPSTYLLRKEVNGNKVDGCGPLESNFCESDFCGSCHTFSHCGGPQGCFACHYHGGRDLMCGFWNGPNF